MNKACATLLGNGDASNLLGKTPFEFIHPDYHEMVRERISRMTSDDCQAPYREILMLRPDGSSVLAESTAIPFKTEEGPAIQVVLRDISERKKIETALANSELRYRAIFDGAGQGIIAADLETRRFLFVNPGMCTLFGYSSEEFLGLSVRGIHPEDAGPMVQEMFEKLARGEARGVTDVPCKRKDGAIFYADVTSSIVQIDGHPSLLGFFSDMTDRVLARRSLVESEARYHNLIENSHDLIQSIDPSGRFFFVNKRWLDVLEYRAEDLPALTIFDVIHPDSLAMCQQEFSSLISGERSCRLAPLFVSRSGKVLDMEGSAVSRRFADGTMVTNAFFLDVTGRKRADLMKTIRLGVSGVLSQSGDIESAIQEILALIGRECGWACGEYWTVEQTGNTLVRQIHWVQPEDARATEFVAASSSFRLETSAGLPGRVWHTNQAFWTIDLASEADFRRPELARGAGFSSALAVPVPVKEGVAGVILFFGRTTRPADQELLASFYEVGLQVGGGITRRTLEAQLEEEHRELARRVEERTIDLRNAKMQAETANVAKSDFLASMSHELRTPLNSIIGFSEIMIGGMVGELSSEQKEYLGDIYDSGKHLLSLINDILDLSKVEAGKMELQAGPVSIREIMRTAVSLFREKTLRHGISFDSEISVTEAEDTMVADERKVKQIIYNLVSNAVKFTADGGTVLVRVGITAEEGARYVRFSVSDTGIGISRDNLKKLFVPFQQIDGSSTRAYGGTGLGLSICNSYAELHGGRVFVESEEGKGSTFGFALPYVPG